MALFLQEAGADLKKIETLLDGGAAPAEAGKVPFLVCSCRGRRCLPYRFLMPFSPFQMLTRMRLLVFLRVPRDDAVGAHQGGESIAFQAAESGQDRREKG